MNKSVGILIIHGFAGTLEDIEPLNKSLLNKGFIIQSVKLKGHTGKRKDLAKASYRDWIASAEESFMELLSQCEKIIVIGFSMGGLIAVNLSMKYNITGIITLSTPIYHWDKKRICLNIVNDFKTKNFKNLRHYVIAAVRIPFIAMINFKILLIKTKALLKKISCPIFIIQGMMDDTVCHWSADYIYSNVSSVQKKIKYYKNSNHIICHSDDRNQVLDDVVLFINDVIKSTN